MIVVKITNGLGNQLFQYAYARMLQNRTKQKIYLDIHDINKMSGRASGAETVTEFSTFRKYQLNDLRITLPAIDKKRVAKYYKRKNIRSKFGHYCKELRLLPVVYVNESMCNEKGFHFSRWQNYYVEGYFFDKKYYEKESELLRQELNLKKKTVISEDLQEILSGRNTVSLHVRRGDFLSLGRNMSGSDYYTKAVNYIKDKVDNPFLLIFSDDIGWVERNMDFESEHRIISGRGYSDCEELKLMSMCRNNIIANSTFSYWGAWLNPNREKIVVSPRGWRPQIIPDPWLQL